MKISDLTQKPLFGGTWLDRKGTSQEYLKTTNSSGPRVVVHRWLDTDEVVVSAMTGNAFKKPATFRKLYEKSLVSPTKQQLARMMNAAAKALGD